MKRFVVILAMLCLARTAAAELPVSWMPRIRQSAFHFSSDRVTMAGMGFGGGAEFILRRNIVARTGASLVWGNGNAVSTRLAIGWQRSGWWSPAVFGTFGLLWGQRTEILSSSGERPPSPVWTTGVSVAPLRFSGRAGTVSALELGCGIGPDNGVNLEMTILAVGASW